MATSIVCRFRGEKIRPTVPQEFIRIALPEGYIFKADFSGGEYEIYGLPRYDGGRVTRYGNGYAFSRSASPSDSIERISWPHVFSFGGKNYFIIDDEEVLTVSRISEYADRGFECAFPDNGGAVSGILHEREGRLFVETGGREFSLPDKKPVAILRGTLAVDCGITDLTA